MAEGEFALVREHLEQADRVSNDPVRWGSAVTEMDFNVLYADAAAQARDAEALQRFVPRAEDEAEHFGHRLYLAIARRARGVQALLEDRPGDAVRFQDEALAVFEQLGTRYQMGLTLGERARAFSALDEQARARADWSQAVELLEAQGARPAAQLARDSLAALQASLD
jgi:nucleotide-binding universal stress UspA family protein